MMCHVDYENENEVSVEEVGTGIKLLRIQKRVNQTLYLTAQEGRLPGCFSKTMPANLLFFGMD